MVKDWNRLPTETAESPSLEAFKVWLSKVLSQPGQVLTFKSLRYRDKAFQVPIQSMSLHINCQIAPNCSDLSILPKTKVQAYPYWVCCVLYLLHSLHYAVSASSFLDTQSYFLRIRKCSWRTLCSLSSYFLLQKECRRREQQLNLLWLIWALVGIDRNNVYSQEVSVLQGKNDSA